MRKIHMGLLMTVLLAAGCANKDLTLEGNVYRDAFKARGLEGVKVESGNVTSVLTDAEGHFAVSGEVVSSDSSIYLFFSKTGFKDQRAQVTIIAKDENSNVIGPDKEIAVIMETNN